MSKFIVVQSLYLRPDGVFVPQSFGISVDRISIIVGDDNSAVVKSKIYWFTGKEERCTSSSLTVEEIVELINKKEG